MTLPRTFLPGTVSNSDVATVIRAQARWIERSPLTYAQAVSLCKGFLHEAFCNGLQGDDVRRYANCELWRSLLDAELDTLGNRP